jgi:two-component system sensor histidine kinase SenX3
MITGRRRSVIFFTVFGICLVAIAVALNVSWVLLNWRMGVLAILGVIFFLFVIAGMVLNTIFLVREIRRNEQHDSFINAVTHELKTPVASIRLYLQTLQTRELDEDKRKEFYRIMLEDSDRLLHTIDQVLRAGSAGPRFRRGARARVDLAELTRECVTLARTRFHLEADVLDYDDQVPVGAAVVLGDPDELKAAVGNLIDNAVKYSPAGVSIQIRLAEVDNDRVAVRVTDHGIGIAPPDLKRIFRRFYRVPATPPVRAKGSGLGLFIVRSVAKKHRGRAFAESPGFGQGSTFTLLLPKAPGA